MTSRDKTVCQQFISTCTSVSNLNFLKTFTESSKCTVVQQEKAVAWANLNRTVFAHWLNCILPLAFSNSLIIRQVRTKEITTVKEVWISGLN